MTASAQNIMVDSLNIYLMKVRKTQFPEVYVMKSYQMEKLRRIDDVKNYMEENKLEEDTFEKCLKHFILDGQFRNNIFAIMRK